MMLKSARHYVAGTCVKVTAPSTVPECSAWDSDRQRTSTSMKRRLQQLFFKGDRRVTGRVVYVGSESTRQQLNKKGMIKIELRDAAGSRIVITADPDNLRRV